jgi:hypothetical protein
MLGMKVFAPAVAISLVLGASVARASATCPDCAPGRQARSEVWSDDFPFYLGVAALPFLLIGGVCLGAEAVGRTRRASGRSSRMKGRK